MVVFTWYPNGTSFSDYRKASKGQAKQTKAEFWFDICNILIFIHFFIPTEIWPLCSKLTYFDLFILSHMFSQGQRNNPIIIWDLEVWLQCKTKLILQNESQRELLSFKFQRKRCCYNDPHMLGSPWSPMAPPEATTRHEEKATKRQGTMSALS